MRQTPAAALSRAFLQYAAAGAVYVSHFPVLFVWVENCQ
jgi:hypothetical protein